MKCINCEAEIPPIFVAAINSNICPVCGKEIMDEQGKTLLTELREAIAKMPNDPEGLAGWLLSNYKLEKFGDAEPVNFHSRNKKQTEEHNENSLLPQERMSKFNKHIQVKNAKFKNLLEEIQKTDDEQPQPIQAQDPDYDPEDVKYFQNNNSYDKEMLNDPQVQEMSNLLAKNISSGPKELQAEKLKKMYLQEQMQYGNVGKINRSV